MVNGGEGPVNSELSPDDAAFFRPAAQPHAAGRRGYPWAMLGRLQDRRGEPNLRTRALAALVVLGLVVLTAPLVVLPIARWVARIL